MLLTRRCWAGAGAGRCPGHTAICHCVLAPVLTLLTAVLSLHTAAVLLCSPPRPASDCRAPESGGAAGPGGAGRGRLLGRAAGDRGCRTELLSPVAAPAPAAALPTRSSFSCPVSRVPGSGPQTFIQTSMQCWKMLGLESTIIRKGPAPPCPCRKCLLLFPHIRNLLRHYYNTNGHLKVVFTDGWLRIFANESVC